MYQSVSLFDPFVHEQTRPVHQSVWEHCCYHCLTGTLHMRLQVSRNKQRQQMDYWKLYGWLHVKYMTERGKRQTRHKRLWTNERKEQKQNKTKKRRKESHCGTVTHSARCSCTINDSKHKYTQGRVGIQRRNTQQQTMKLRQQASRQTDRHSDYTADRGKKEGHNN